MAAQAGVAAGSEASAAAAVAVLRRGGNAVDAALAAGFAGAVAEPGLTSLGGGGFLLLRASDGEHQALDFFVDAPGHGLEPGRTPHFTPVLVTFAGAEQVFHAGWGSVAVPGCLDGYLTAHRRHGRLPLADVVAPAVSYARDGVELAAHQAQVLGLLTGIVTLTQTGRELFAPDGFVVAAGARLHNRALADLLDQLADGTISGVASASVADPLVAAMAEHNGLLTSADLAGYRPVSRTPLTMTYRKARIATNPPPSFGGSILTGALAELSQGPGVTASNSDTRRLVEALIVATDRRKAVSQAPQSTRGTTHVSVVDSEGLMVSMTTSNGSCSGVFAPGTGVQLNNVLGEDDLHPDGFHAVPAGTRIGSMMSPTIVERPDGSVVALGSGGSQRIRSALLQVVVHLVDHGLDVDAAVEAPRLHWDGRQVQAEPGWTDAAVEAIAQWAPVNRWGQRDLYFGGVQAVAVDPTGRVSAKGDPRRGGVGLVVDL
ncbi:MAG: gamma-glutamyltransferase [Actinomycetes bacterium]